MLSPECITSCALCFLQGDIEKVASRSPEGLTALFESIAGSDVLKKDYEAAEAAKVGDGRHLVC